MDVGAVAAALEEARFDARQASRYEDLADDLRGPAELAEWERIAALIAAAGPGAVYDPDVDEVVRAELGADAVAAAAREAELREAVRIAARASHLQVLRDLGTLDQAEPAEGDEAVREELIRRAGGYVQADVDVWLAHALAAHRGHYADPAAREAAAGLLTAPVRAHAALLDELLRLVPGTDADQLAFAARLAATEPEAVDALAAPVIGAATLPQLDPAAPLSQAGLSGHDGHRLGGTPTAVTRRGRVRNPDAVRHECAECGAKTKVNTRTGRLYSHQRPGTLASRSTSGDVVAAPRGGGPTLLPPLRTVQEGPAADPPRRVADAFEQRSDGAGWPSRSR